MNTQDKLQLLGKLISELTLAETSELVGILRDKYNIEIINSVIEKPVYITPGDGDWTPDETPDETSVFLESPGPFRINVLRCIKEEYDLGLKYAKELMDSAPCNLPKMHSYKSNMILNKLKQFGALVHIS